MLDYIAAGGVVTFTDGPHAAFRHRFQNPSVRYWSKICSPRRLAACNT